MWTIAAVLTFRPQPEWCDNERPASATMPAIRFNSQMPPEGSRSDDADVDGILGYEVE